jgi:hypothetical protein
MAAGINGYISESGNHEEIFMIAECMYERCHNPIFIGEPNWDLGGEWFCSSACVARSLGAARRIVRLEYD